MSLRSCCVPQCYDMCSKRCSLPRNEKLRSIWMRRAGCEHLLKKFKLRSGFMCSRHFHDACFKANGRLLLNCLPTKYLPDGIRMVESNTILTHTSPLESVIKPAKVYPGKRRLVQPIVELGDIPGPSHEYVHVTSNIATVPGSKDTLSKGSRGGSAPELCTLKKFKDDILPGDRPFTAVTSKIAASATVSSVRRVTLKVVKITEVLQGDSRSICHLATKFCMRA
ncbi:uncharacterized protein LOC109532813 isoform X3 [Dendroctonus ponderosae]|uniref:uncharacterized protein LOC109532813 isoform X3 n=1 Tax=Dendroctonus ponderosae TaxID=77166 RepID=UPI0020363F42|nr:uncharacterized protein LOC109532813 isoform X3 [Dendroctonus ponderosae]